jgi:hypothetical protein
MNYAMNSNLISPTTSIYNNISSLSNNLNNYVLSNNLLSSASKLNYDIFTNNSKLASTNSSLNRGYI